MKKTQLLILGNSSFLRRRVIPAIKKLKDIEYTICSKSNKINFKKKIFFNDYDVALSNTTANIVYISLINSLHSVISLINCMISFQLLHSFIHSFTSLVYYTNSLISFNFVDIVSIL